MFCSNCGNELKEGQKFCNVCGAPVASRPKMTAESVQADESAENNQTGQFENEAAVANQPEEVRVQTEDVGSKVENVYTPVENVYEHVENTQKQMNNNVDNTVNAMPNYNWGNDDVVSTAPANNIFVRALGSVPMLLLCIFYTVSIMYGVITSVFNPMSFGEGSNATNFISSLSSSAVSFVMLIGLWLIYIASKTGKVNKGGVICVKVASIINLVLRCIVYVLVAIVCIAVMIMALTQISSMSGAAAGIVIFVYAFILIGAIVVMILDIISIKNLCKIGTAVVAGVQARLKTGLLRFIYMVLVVWGFFVFFIELVVSAMIDTELKLRMYRDIVEPICDSIRDIDKELAYQFRDMFISIIDNLSTIFLVAAFSTLIAVMVHLFAFIVLGKLKNAARS